MRTTQPSRKRVRTIRRRRLVLALVAALALPPSVAQNLPTGGTVVNGDATFSTNPGGTNLTINQTTRGAIINWGTFNIAPGFGVAFNQPGSNGVTLNRVLGTLASDISGVLTANGNVFIINTNGITFGGTAQVNVGGLMASTLALSDAAFLTGLATGNFQFSGTTGTPQLVNNGNITAGTGGVGMVGPVLLNRGNIVANGGNIGLGAATSVTVDFVGDGLTQVTINAPSDVEALIAQNDRGTMTADGGRLLWRTAATAGGAGGAIYAGGVLRAQTISNVNGRVELTSSGGPVVLGAPGILSDSNAIFTPGAVDVTGPGAQTGGSVLLQGRGVTLVNDSNPLSPADPLAQGSRIDASGGGGGGTVELQSGADVVLYAGSRISAEGIGAGHGGTVRLLGAGDVIALGEVSAAAGAVGGSGGTIALASSGGSVLVGADLDAGGSASGDGGEILLYAPGGFAALTASARASGGANGGTVQMLGGQVLLGEDAFVTVEGQSGGGGTIALAAGGNLLAYGNLIARGGTLGGQVLTAAGQQFDIRGLSVDAGGGPGGPGRWTLWAPDINVVDGLASGSFGTSVLSQDVQDADINRALDSGTSVTLRAGTTPDSGGNVDFARGVAIQATRSTTPLAFRVDANGSISGANFSIAGYGGPLAMDFNADASGVSPGSGRIDLANAYLDSYGGDIRLYGQSDAAGGMASGLDRGVSLRGSFIQTGGGNFLARGASTGGDAGSDDAGVVLESTDVYTYGGNATLHGTGANGTGGVYLGGGLIHAGFPVFNDVLTLAALPPLGGASGAIDITGSALGDGDGIRVWNHALQTEAGYIALRGSSSGAGTGTSIIGSTLQTQGGDIGALGQSAAGVGLLVAGDFGRVGAITDVPAVGGAFAIASAGGRIFLEGHGADAGVAMLDGDLSSVGNNPVDSAGGNIDVLGTASAVGGVGVYLGGIPLAGGTGNVTVNGSAPAGTGILFADGAGVGTTSGAITLIGRGANFGLDVGDGAIETDSGDLTLEGDATSASAIAGVRVTGGGLATAGGNIRVTGTTAGGIGVQLGNGVDPFAIGSGGGAISITGSGVTEGVLMRGNQVDSGGGGVVIAGEASGGAATGVDLINARVDSRGGAINIDGHASGGSASGVDLINAQLTSGTGDIAVRGVATNGSGVNLTLSRIITTAGDIRMTGIGGLTGLDLVRSELSTDSGHIDLRGRGMNGTAFFGLPRGMLIDSGTRIATNSGGIALSGEAAIGAGIYLLRDASVDAGNSLVVLRAGNNGSNDAVSIGGTIRSGLGVNLRPGGVDAQGEVTERTGDGIVLGTGSGFALDADELGRITTPELVVGSNQHAGAIRVLQASTRAGNLTLQNQGGSGGIDVRAALDVGPGTLALATGGDITQTVEGAITARSLLAIAGGDVRLATARNNVASTTLAGTAGGDFEFQDVDTLAIGSVSARGMDAGTDALAGIGATGIAAGGDVFVRNLAGDLTLNAEVSGADIDLVTAGRLQNPAGASLSASGNWRVWAETWVGETRGGLSGSGELPNLYGCAYLGVCGVTVPGQDNHFIYVQQPTALISFGNATREYGLPNPVLTFTVTGAILGDSPANVAAGTPTTTATVGSNVGLYPITGSFASRAGYRIQLVPGTLAVTPATLLFIADPAVRYLGTANPQFSGTVTGFRNGDTVQSVFGNGVIWSSPAGILSPIGFYPVNGGTTATNYVFTQAPGNATALQIIPLPQLSSTPIDLIRETVNTYVYDRNFGGAPMCAVNASLEDMELASTGDDLANEWSKVRTRPNLTNCFDTQRKNSCGDF